MNDNKGVDSHQIPENNLVVLFIVTTVLIIVCKLLDRTYSQPTPTPTDLATEVAYPYVREDIQFPTSNPDAPLAIYGPIYINGRRDAFNVFGTFNLSSSDVAIYIFLIDRYGDYYPSGTITLLDDQYGVWMTRILLHPTKGPDPDEIEGVIAIAVSDYRSAMITDILEYSDLSDPFSRDMINNIIDFEDYPVAYAPVTQADAPFETSTSADQAIQNSTQTIREVFTSVEEQIMRDIQGNIAFNKPEKMNRGETEIIELLLSPIQSEVDLATQVVERRGIATSTAASNVLITPRGEIVSVETSCIEITPRMKAILVPYDADAFVVLAMHDDAEQVITSSDLTIWRWSVTAREEGIQTLELILYQLIKYDGKEFWHEVETYQADIVVEVTFSDWLKSLDWKWIAGFALTLIGSILGVLNWAKNRDKKKTSHTKGQDDGENKKKRNI